MGQQGRRRRRAEHFQRFYLFIYLFIFKIAIYFLFNLVYNRTGQVLAVINDDDKEWWQGRTMDGVVGWFPAALVVPCSSGKAADQQVVEAMYDFVGKTNDELSLVRGDIIRILWASDDHWAKGERLSDKRTGWFPTNIVALSDSDDDEI